MTDSSLDAAVPCPADRGSSQSPSEHPVVFLWENFGPVHADRCKAVAQSGLSVVGLELYERSDVYEWDPEVDASFRKVTLFSGRRVRGMGLIRALFQFRRRNGRATWFLCHYDWPEVFLFAIVLRILGDPVFTMGCSKFDDLRRRVLREFLKSLFFLPYQGALASGRRSKDYFRFLGIQESMVVGEYNTVSIERIRALSGSVPAPGGVPFEVRDFIVVARLVPKKNIALALAAFAILVRSSDQPRRLQICGSGPLGSELRELCRSLDISSHVVFNGFVQTRDVSRLLASSLALILPSVEEQFGNVVIEAQAMGVPVILSDNCGARDSLVRSGVNGFVVEPDNPEGLAWFMARIAEDEAMWRRFCEASTSATGISDTMSFAKGIRELINRASH